MKKLLFLFLGAALSLTSCRDKCKDVECNNGGRCDEGECICVDGYSGEDCSTALEPTKIRITSIEIQDFPDDDAGADWDPLIETDPDIIIKLTRVSDGNQIYESGNFDNVAPGTQFSIDALTIDVISVSEEFTLSMRDYDQTSADDPMGDITFNLWTGGSFPPTKIVEDTALGIKYVLHLSYTH